MIFLCGNLATCARTWPKLLMQDEEANYFIFHMARCLGRTKTGNSYLFKTSLSIIYALNYLQQLSFLSLFVDTHLRTCKCSSACWRLSLRKQFFTYVRHYLLGLFWSKNFIITKLMFTHWRKCVILKNLSFSPIKWQW
jgi:hypothetical protein